MNGIFVSSLCADYFGSDAGRQTDLDAISSSSSSMPTSPETGFDQWSCFWRTAGRYWKRYVSVLMSPADVKGVELSSPSVLREQCGKAFRTNAALKVHRHHTDNL